MKKTAVICMIVSLLAASCFRNGNEEAASSAADVSSAANIFTPPENEISLPAVISELQPDMIVTPQDSDSGEFVKIRIFTIYDSEFSCQSANLPLDNFPENAAEYLNSNTMFSVRSISYEGERLIVDFDHGFLTRLEGMGSSGGLCLSNSILHTFSGFPGVKEMKFLFNGEEDVWGDHFSFEGIFPAGSHRWTAPAFGESDITDIWESEGDERRIFYFMNDSVFKEGTRSGSRVIEDYELARTGTWELIGNMLIITFESTATEHFFVSINDEKLALEYSGLLVNNLIKSNYFP